MESLPSRGTPKNSREVYACSQILVNLAIHCSTDQFSTPRPRAMIPAVLKALMRYTVNDKEKTYPVPTIRSKKAWIGKSPPN
jgi:hypothetical protein